jgi:flagellar hook-associated protein 3 FlgL
MPSVSMARERSLYLNNTNRNLPEIRAELSRLREQVSTGTRINRPSDDPDGFAVAEQLKTVKNQYTRYEASIAAARPWVDQTQATTDRMADLFAQAYEEGVQAADDTRSADDRAILADQLRSLRDEVVDQLNTRYNGEYLFAGNRTLEKPFDAAGQPAVSAAAISGDRVRAIGPDQSLKINLSGQELTDMGGGDTIVSALDDLITAVDSGTTDDIRTALDTAGQARDQVIDMGAQIGTVGRRLSAAQDQLDSAKLTVEQRRSSVEDTDFYEAVSALQQTQTQLQAALRATASTLQTSLVNFLR